MAMEPVRAQRIEGQKPVPAFSRLAHGIIALLRSLLGVPVHLRFILMGF